MANTVSTLEVVATQSHKTAKQTINTKIITYTYNHADNGTPNDVSFNAVGDNSQSYLSGSYSSTSFHIHFSDFKKSDFELSNEILTTCKAITA